MHLARVRMYFTVGLALMTTVVFGQGSDSIAQKAQAYAASKFAIARPLNIEFANAGSYKFTSKLRDVPSIGGEVKRFSQLKASATINFIRKESWMLSGTLGYRFTTVESDIVKPVSNTVKTINDEFHYQFSSLNFSYFSRLFNKRTIYTASVLVDGSEKHFERVKGVITGTMVLKANQRTKMMAGIMISIDPSAQSPFIPTFSYEHKFRNGIVVDILLPRSILVRKHVFTNGRISVGTEMDRTSFYLYNVDGTSQKYEYRQLDINSGLIYEHLIANYFVLAAKTGVKITPSGRIFRKEGTFGSPELQTSPDPAFYLNAGISFNPFIKKRKK
jgi:hypothetical protein